MSSTKVTVTDKALHEMVREALFNKAFQGWSSNEEGPATVDPVVDPSQAVTDPINPNFTPQTKTEFGVAVNQLVKNLPDTQMPALFDTVKGALEAAEDGEGDAKDSEGRNKEMDKKAAAGGTGVEEGVRLAVRKALSDMLERGAEIRALTEAPPKKFGPVVGDLPPVKKIPAGEHGAEYLRHREKYRGDLKKILGTADLDAAEAEDDAEEVEAEPAKKRAYKGTAIGGMTDVSGASFEQIAGKLGFSVAGAKQAVDKALEKAQFLAQDISEDDLEILVLNALNDYIKMLSKSGEMSPADVQLMKDHPDIVRELDGFREFLHTQIKRVRKADQKLVDPLEDDGSGAPAGVDSDYGTHPGEELKDTTKPAPKAGKAKDSYKVYPYRGKRHVVRVGGKLYGTEADGALKDGGKTQFKAGDRAKVTRAGDKLSVGKTDSDHSQTWDPVEESTLKGNKHLKLVRAALKEFGNK